MHFRWNLPWERVRSRLLALGSVQPRLGHSLSRKHLGRNRFTSDPREQVDRVLVVRRPHQANAILDLLKSSIHPASTCQANYAYCTECVYDFVVNSRQLFLNPMFDFYLAL
jgi:hypothetical protein